MNLIFFIYFYNFYYIYIEIQGICTQNDPVIQDIYVLSFLVSSLTIFNINENFEDSYFKKFFQITLAFNHLKISKEV